MKKVLAVVIAVAFISIGAFSPHAQVPNVTIYAVDTLEHRELAQDRGILADVLTFLGY